MTEQNDLDFEVKEMPVATIDSDSDKSVMEIAPVNMVEALIEETERRVECVQKMKRIIFKVTTINDWIDQNGKPYLQTTGSESIAMALSIGWDRPEMKVIDHDDGHKTFEFSTHFYFLGQKKWFIGNRSSSGSFYSRKNGQDVPPKAIDMANVKKAAYTNLLNNGIQRILGIRGMTWEQLEKAYGMKAKDASKVDYSQKKITGPQRNRLLAIGKDCGWSKDDVSKYIKDTYNYDSTTDILTKDYEAICNYVGANTK